MRNLFPVGALALLGAALLAQPVFPHGGVYRGPGDTVPPGGGARRGGGSAGPAGPGPMVPGGPAPNSAPTGIPGVPNGPQQQNGTMSQNGQVSVDLTGWSFWWEFNKDPFLQLRDAIHSLGAESSIEGYFLGQGQVDQRTTTLAPPQTMVRQTIVPALLGALESESSNDIVTGSMIALARIGDEVREDGSSPFAEAFLPFLRSGSQEIRETVAVALGVLGHASSIDELVSLATDDARGRKLMGKASVDERTRTYAAYGLGLSANRAVDEDLRASVYATLASLLDTNERRDLEVAAVLSIGLVPLDAEGRGAQVDRLLAVFRDKTGDALVRAHVPRSLALLLSEGDVWQGPAADAKRAEVAGVLLEALDRFADEPREVVQSCALALSRLAMGQDELAQKVQRELTKLPEVHADLQVRAFSCIALGELAGGSDPVRAREAQTELIRRLVKGKSTLRPWAALGLGVAGYRIAGRGELVPDGLVAPLRKRFEDEQNPERIGAYAIALGLTGDADSKSPLRAKLDRIRDDTARGYICVALGLVGDAESRSTLTELAGNSMYRSELLRQVAVGLGLLGDKDAVRTLVTMLEDSKSLAAQAAVAISLGTIGDRHAVHPLLTLLADKGKTERARGIAAAALGRVADRDKLPWNSVLSVELNYRANTPTLTDPTGAGLLDLL